MSNRLSGAGIVAPPGGLTAWTQRLIHVHASPLASTSCSGLGNARQLAGDGLPAVAPLDPDVGEAVLAAGILATYGRPDCAPSGNHRGVAVSAHLHSIGLYLRDGEVTRFDGLDLALLVDDRPVGVDTAVVVGQVPLQEVGVTPDVRFQPLQF